MELSVSPDLEAFWCYLIVLAAGVWVATQQIGTRLQGFKGWWLVPQTWVLFSLYLCIPVSLFWFLDRTDAVRDTSLFAALLVGFGYERILAGNNSSVGVPSGASQIWNPLIALANTIAQTIREKVRRKDIRLKRKFISKIIPDKDRLNSLAELALKTTADVAILKKTIDDIKNDAGLGDQARTERTAEALYEEVSADDDFLYEMRQKKIVSLTWYLVNNGSMGKLVTATVLVSLIVAGLYGASKTINRDELAARYTVWRITKSNTSERDVERQGRRLSSLLTSKNAASFTMQHTITALRQPDLAVERADRLIDTLFEMLGNPAGLAADLVPALKTSNVDTRARVHRALLYVAEQGNITPAILAGLESWKPAEGDSVTDLQRRIDEWNAAWSAPADKQS